MMVGPHAPIDFRAFITSGGFKLQWIIRSNGIVDTIIIRSCNYTNNIIGACNEAIVSRLLPLYNKDPLGTISMEVNLDYAEPSLIGHYRTLIAMSNGARSLESNYWIAGKLALFYIQFYN